ncbi:MAG: choice-of-anchor D domain-containing protein [Verrucomicrobiota bacterium]
MADSYFDTHGSHRDKPGFQLPDQVSPLNRIYGDSISVAADLVKQFPKTETAPREVLTCTAPISGAENKIVLTGGYELILDGTGAATTTLAQSLVINLSEVATAAEVAVQVAREVNGWKAMFTAIANGATVGIFTPKGASAVVSNTLGWLASSAEVTLMRPGLPEECIPGTYHPRCQYLILVGVQQTAANDTHVTFSRRWRVDLRKLDESSVLDLEAILRLGAKTTQQLQKPLAPPSQFLPWLKTISETAKARPDASPDNLPALAGSSVVEEDLASASKTNTRQEWGTPFQLLTSTMDADTGVVQESIQEVVAAGTSATAITPEGKVSTVQDVDNLWAVKNTRKAAGLAGTAVNGVANRTYQFQDNYSWPGVLDYIDIQVALSDPGDIYSPPNGYSWRPVWLVEDYSGPCTYTLVERWTLKKPIIGGNPSWNSTMAEDQSPHLPTETPMQTRAIDFRGSALRVPLGPSLHVTQRIWDGQFFQQFPATTPPRWPATILSRVSLSPDQGGWLTRMFYVDAPAIAGQRTGIDLNQTDETGSSFTLGWTGHTGDPVLTHLDVSTDPAFESGYLLRGTVVTSVTTYEVTGVQRGIIYYARIKRGGIISNTCICSTKPQPELQVSYLGQILSSGDTLNIGRAPIGDFISKSLNVQNIGLLTLRDLAASLSGTHADQFTAATLPAILAPGSVSVPLALRFEPTSTGAKTSVLSITSNDATSPFLLNLSATGDAGEIMVEQPAGNEIVNDGTVPFGTVTSGSVSKVFKVLNVGNAPLRALSVNIAGEDVSDFNVTAALPVTEIAANGAAYFTVTFEPVAGEVADTRTAVLTIRSSDEDESPFEIILTGLYQSPTAPGALDDDFNPNVNGDVYAVVIQPDGKMVIGGSFSTVGGTGRNNIARLNADGSLDAGFNPNANGEVFALAIQDDGEILLGGNFLIVGGSSATHLARVDSSGVLDTSFTPGPSAAVYAIAVQNDGKIIIGGAFPSLVAGAREYCARLNLDGTLDAAFDTEIPGLVYGITIQADGKIMVVGDWTSVMTPTPTPTFTPPPTASDSPSPTASDSPSPSPTASDSPSPTPPPSTPPPTSSNSPSLPPVTASDSPSPPPVTASDSPSPPPITASDSPSPPPVTASDSPSPPP